MITHDRYFLDNVVGWMLEMDHGKGIPYEGNYSTYLDAKKVAEAEKFTIETAFKKGIHPRVELNDASGFERYLEMGVKHFNIGIDVRTLYTWFCDQGSILRKELGLEPLASEKQLQASYGR